MCKKFLSCTLCAAMYAGVFANDECCCNNSAFDGFSLGAVGYYSSEKIENNLKIYQMWNELGDKSFDDVRNKAIWLLLETCPDVSVWNAQIGKVFRSTIKGELEEDILGTDAVSGNLSDDYIYTKADAPKFNNKSTRHSRKSNVGGIGLLLTYRWQNANSNIVFGVEGDAGFSFKNKKTKHASKEKAMIIDVDVDDAVNGEYLKAMANDFAVPVIKKNCDEVYLFELATATYKPDLEVQYTDVVRYDETKAKIETKRSSFQPAAYLTAGFVFDKNILVELGVGAAHVKAEQIISDEDIDWRKTVKCSKVTPSMKLQVSYGVAENVSVMAFGRYDFNVKKGSMKIKNNYTVGVGVSYRLGS